MEIPDGITITVDGLSVKAKGPKGELERRFSASGTSIKTDGKSIGVESNSRALAGTIAAHIRNMINGVQNGYAMKLKMIYAHFPFTLEIKGGKINVKNMLGEKMPRTSKIIGSTKIEVKGQEIIISGADKDAVGQTVANLKAALRIKGKDCRVFQDGVYEVQD